MNILTIYNVEITDAGEVQGQRRIIIRNEVALSTDINELLKPSKMQI